MSAMTQNTATQNAAVDATRTVTINVPNASDVIGLGGVISWLLLAAAWGVVGIAYICVPGSLAGALLAVVSAFTSFGAGLLPFALCLGVAIGCMGLCIPCLQVADALRCLLLKRPVVVRNQRLLVISAVVLLVGCAIAGVATLAGGAGAVVLPAFLQGMVA